MSRFICAARPHLMWAYFLAAVECAAYDGPHLQRLNMYRVMIIT